VYAIPTTAVAFEDAPRHAEADDTIIGLPRRSKLSTALNVRTLKALVRHRKSPWLSRAVCGQKGLGLEHGFRDPSSFAERLEQATAYGGPLPGMPAVFAWFEPDIFFAIASRRRIVQAYRRGRLTDDRPAAWAYACKVRALHKPGRAKARSPGV